MVGSTEIADGKKGFVPAPDKGPPNRFLNSGGIWTPPEGGSAETANTATKALQDGDGNVIKNTYVKRIGGILRGETVNFSTTGNGCVDSYLRFAKLDINTVQCSAPIYMTIQGKNNLLMSVGVSFSNGGHNDPGLDFFRASGAIGSGHGLYIARTAFGQWYIFLKGNPYDHYAVGNLCAGLGGNVQPKVGFESVAVSSLPTGTIAATEVASIL